MSLFDRELEIAAADMLPTMGDKVFVNGYSYQAIINDDQFIDETGIRRETSVSFKSSIKGYIAVGDIIVFDEVTYLVRQIPEPNKEDPFYTVEVKRA